MRETQFISYDYKECTISKQQLSFYIDSYKNFGWEQDENVPPNSGTEKVTLRLKRNRKIINKMELTRLERNFEACINEIQGLNRAKTKDATMVSVVIGVIGTAFMAGSVFAVTNEPPIIWLCILLAIPGFIGWIAPCFVYKKMVKKKVEQINYLIEKEKEEIYDLCEKGSRLLF